MSTRLFPLLLLLGLPLLLGAELPRVPVESNVEVQLYLDRVRRQQPTLTITTTNPNGARRGRLGEQVVYNNAGAYKMCLNIDGGQGGTTWRCNANALTAP